MFDTRAGLFVQNIFGFNKFLPFPKYVQKRAGLLIQNSASSFKIDKCSLFPFSCVIEFLIKLFSSPHLMRCVGSKSTNFAPTDRSFIFALFHNKYTLLLLNWKSLYYPLCFDQGVGQCAVSVSTKIMAASSLTYMRRTSLYNNTQQHSRRSGWELGNLQQQQLCTWVWCSAVQQRHARGAGERERGRNEFIFWLRCKVLAAAGIKTVAVKVIITAHWPATPSAGAEEKR